MHTTALGAARRFFALLLPLLLARISAPAEGAAGPSDEGILKVTGTVQMPDGALAANVIVTTIGESGLAIPEVSARRPDRSCT